MIITIDDVQRVQAATGINLLEPGLCERGTPAGRKRGDLPLCRVLQSDLLRFYDVLQALLEPDAETNNISAAEFGRRLSGVCLFAAHESFFDAWHDLLLQLRLAREAGMVGKTGALIQKIYRRFQVIKR